MESNYNSYSIEMEYRMKRKKIAGIFIFMALILICIGRIMYVDAVGASEETSVTLLQNNTTASPVPNEVTTMALPTTNAVITVPDSIIKLNANYSVMNQKATIKVSASAKYGLKKLVYVKGNIGSVTSSKWKGAKSILKSKKFQTKKKGTYSILAKDAKGNKKIVKVSVVMEMKAVWVYYEEMNKKAKSFNTWKKYIDKTFDTCKSMQMNTVIFQVRPCADAMYASQYFPWSKYATGTAGKNPGFDPFQYAVEAAHQRGLSIQAWVNPYRITIHSTKISSLPKDSIARKWATSTNASERRNVLKVNGALYFNPASAAVRSLVAKGVREIVTNYDVDGIHMDDYFYPSLGTKNYKKFDYKEYRSYVKSRKAVGKKQRSLVSWRRANVNKMVQKVYSTIKKADKKCVFGISPAGNLGNLYSKTAYYSPVKTWMKSTKYIDYICPQIYWSFTQKTVPYKKVVKQWTAIKRSSKVNLYIGLAGYRAGITMKEAKAVYDTGWAKSNTILKRQVEYARKTKKVDGFCIFSYNTFTRQKAAKEVKNLQKVIGSR